jgi:3D-(3,5/4)-trihydroxycyclohexane-1,2-dione acylhydrolase (decyclizing)
MTESTVRLTAAPALVRYLQAQYSERDGHTQRAIPAIFGIFGHGNVLGRRLATLACTASIGPGSANMPTAAATATVNRLPVLLLPSQTSANRRQGPRTRHHTADHLARSLLQRHY